MRSNAVHKLSCPRQKHDACDDHQGGGRHDFLVLGPQGPATGAMFPVTRTYGGKKKAPLVSIARDESPTQAGVFSAGGSNASHAGAAARGGTGLSSRTPLRSIDNLEEVLAAAKATGVKKAVPPSTGPTAMSVVQHSKAAGSMISHVKKKGKREPPGTPESTPSAAKSRIFSPAVPMSHRQPDRVARRLSTSFSSFPSSSTTPRLSTSSSAVPSTASSSAMSIARSSSSSSSASLPPSTVSKPAPLPRCFLRADAEDLNYLYDEMVGKKESKPFLGFGKGFVLFPPAEWEPCQRLRLRNFCCDTLGFEAKTHDGRVYLQLGTKKVEKLKRDLKAWRSSATPSLSLLSTSSMLVDETMMEDSAAMTSTYGRFSIGRRGSSISSRKPPAPLRAAPPRPAEPLPLEPRLSDVMASLGNLVIKEGNEEEEDEEEGAGGPRHSPPCSPLPLEMSPLPGLSMADGLASPCFSDGSEDHSGGAFIIRKRPSAHERRGSSPPCRGRGSRSPLRSCSRTPPHSPFSDGSTGGLGQDHGRRHRHSHRESGGGRTFETPSSVRPHEWVTSKRANTASIERLTLRFQKEEELFELEDGHRISLGLLPEPHLRYSLPSPPHAPTGMEEERRAMERSRRSKALMRRLSMGITARPRFSLSRAFTSLAIVDEPDASMADDDEEEAESTQQPDATAGEAGTTTAAISKLGLLTVSCLEFLPLKDLPASLCRAWAAGFYPLHAQARILSDLDHGHSRHPEIFVDWPSLASTFPCGQHLSDGAFKSVYRVWCTRSGRVEAVSVMDVQAINETGNTAVVEQELHASILAAGLVRNRVCPNLVETYGVLRSAYDPNHAGMWACDDESFLLRRTGGRRRAPQEAGQGAGGGGAGRDFQLIRMELCRHGDLEGFLRRQPDGLVPADVALQLTFQMCFSLYAVRASLAMRHYDVKLLNFLVTDFQPPAATQTAQHQPPAGPVVRYGLGRHVYRMRMRQPWNLCVKLADFGTADVCEASLGGHIGMERFTTLENTPPEFLVEGDKVQLHYSADTFPLGLAVLHLFTGAMPYEEWMADVTCPPELRAALAKVWQGHDDFTTLASLIDALDEEEDEAAVLYHTFYRYLVLLGLPDEQDREPGPVWKATTALIAPQDALQDDEEEVAAPQQPPAATGGRKAAAAAAASLRSRAKAKPKLSKKAAKVTSQYWKDHARYSLSCGSQPLIARARARLEALPGAMDLLRSLMHFRPQRRTGMHAAMESLAFESLREDAAADHHHHHDSPDTTLSFLAFSEREATPGQSKRVKTINNCV